MKIKQFIILPLLLSGVFTSCNKQPSAGFSVDDDNPISGQRVYFTSESIDAVTYEWDFGDTYGSTGETSSHVYNGSGSFQATLTVYSSNEKKSDSFSRFITVKAPTRELMVNEWDYVSFTEAYYEDGVLESENTNYLADSYDTHTIEFLENNTYIAIIDDFTSEGDWSLNESNNSFTFDGELYHILALTNSLFDFVSTNSYTADGVEHTDSSFVHFTR